MRIIFKNLFLFKIKAITRFPELSMTHPGPFRAFQVKNWAKKTLVRPIPQNRFDLTWLLPCWVVQSIYFQDPPTVQWFSLYQPAQRTGLFCLLLLEAYLLWPFDHQGASGATSAHNVEGEWKVVTQHHFEIWNKEENRNEQSPTPTKS